MRYWAVRWAGCSAAHSAVLKVVLMAVVMAVLMGCCLVFLMVAPRADPKVPHLAASKAFPMALPTERCWVDSTACHWADLRAAHSVDPTVCH